MKRFNYSRSKVHYSEQSEMIWRAKDGPKIHSNRACYKFTNIWKHLKKERKVLQLTVLFGVTFCIFQLILTLIWSFRLNQGNGSFKVSLDSVCNTTFPNFVFSPTSSLRPSGQYERRKWIPEERPIMTLITVTHGPNLSSFQETVRFVRTQSLQPLRWIILCDHVADEKKFAFLKKVGLSDPRFVLVNNSGDPGVANARQSALEFFKRTPTKYVAFIDDDDQMELNTYEKFAWALESNEDISMAMGYAIVFGHENFTWYHGYHDGAANLKRNYLTTISLMRTSSVLQTGCKFNAEFNGGYDDWDYLMCLASNGLWGITVPEILYWYRRNSLSVRSSRWPSLFDPNQKKLHDIRNKYIWMKHSFPVAKLRRSEKNSTISMEVPFRNSLRKRKGVLFIVDWIGNQKTKNTFVTIVREFTRRGFVITLLCTQRGSSDTSESQYPFQHFTHDIFVLPSFLRLVDAPRFLKYLMYSRSIEQVVVSHSAVAYGIIPFLKQMYVTVPVSDIVLDWKSGTGNRSFVSLSQQFANSIDLTIAGNERIRRVMLTQGRQRSQVTSASILENDGFLKIAEQERDELREKLDIPSTAIVVLVFEHVDYKPLKAFIREVVKTATRSQDIGRNLSQDIFIMFVIEGSPVEINLSLPENMQTKLRVHGTEKLREEEKMRYLHISDILCVTSKSENNMELVSNAMALGVVHVMPSSKESRTTFFDRGDAGVAVNLTYGNGKVAASFLDALNKIIRNNDMRLKLSSRSRMVSQKYHSLDKEVRKLVGRILRLNRWNTRYSKRPPYFSSVQKTYRELHNLEPHLSDFPVKYEEVLNRAQK